MSQRVLVTGIKGFTGRYMAQKLQSLDYEVWGLSSDQDSSPLTCQIVTGNLTEPASLEAAVRTCQPNYVVHLAGIAFVGHSSPAAFYNVSLIGTHYLLQALSSHASDLKCVLLASSANVYGNGAEGLLSETTPPNPANDYAVSKLAMEHMAQL